MKSEGRHAKLVGESGWEKKKFLPKTASGAKALKG